MKKLLLAVLSILLTTSAAFSQQREERQRSPQERQERMERVHAVKVAYITDKLHFSSEQSAHFWPIYNDYEQEMQNIRKNFFQKYHDKNGDIDKREAHQYIDDDLDYQEQILQLKRKYNEQFLKILSAQQVADLYRAEREFKQMLLQQLRERHGGGGWNGGGNNAYRP